MVFITIGVISFALGILNYFFAHDPRYAQDNKSVLKEHQHSMSFWGAIAEMKRIVVIPSFAIIILQASVNRKTADVGFMYLHNVQMRLLPKTAE